MLEVKLDGMFQRYWKKSFAVATRDQLLLFDDGGSMAAAQGSPHTVIELNASRVVVIAHPRGYPGYFEVHPPETFDL